MAEAENAVEEARRGQVRPGGRDGIPTHLTLDKAGRVCPGCNGEGCSYCGWKGRIWKNRADPYPVRGGMKYASDVLGWDVLAKIDEQYHVVVAPDAAPAWLAEQLEPLTWFYEHVVELLLAAEFEDGVETADIHAKYERDLSAFRRRLEAIRQGALKAYPAYRLTDEQVAQKRRDEARAATRILTHMAYVVDVNQGRRVWAVREKKGKEERYIRKWVYRFVPELTRAAFDIVETMVQLSLFENSERGESEYQKLRRKLVGTAETD